MSAFEYDWQRSEGFLKWLLVAALPEGMDWHRDGTFDRLSDATDRFTDVRLTLSVNGIELDTAKLVERLEGVLDHEARVQAARMIDTVDADELYDTVQDVLNYASRALRERFAEHGIQLPEEDE